MKEQFQDVIKDAWSMLSALRRETGMEQKVMKKDLNQINKEFIDSCEIIDDLEKIRNRLNSAYL